MAASTASTKIDEKVELPPLKSVSLLYGILAGNTSAPFPPTVSGAVFNTTANSYAANGVTVVGPTASIQDYQYAWAGAGNLTGSDSGMQLNASSSSEFSSLVAYIACVAPGACTATYAVTNTDVPMEITSASGQLPSQWALDVAEDGLSFTLTTLSSPFPFAVWVCAVVNTGSGDLGINSLSLVNSTAPAYTPGPQAVVMFSNSISLTATLQNNGTQVLLSWTAPSPVQVFDNYEVYQDGGVAYSTASTSVTLDLPNPDTAYTFQVVAVGSASEFISLSNPVFTTSSPSALTLSAFLIGMNANLSWTEPLLTVDHYDVYQNGELLLITTSTTAIAPITCGQSYEFQVFAISADGDTIGISNTASVTYETDHMATDVQVQVDCDSVVVSWRPCDPSFIPDPETTFWYVQNMLNPGAAPVKVPVDAFSVRLYPERCTFVSYVVYQSYFDATLNAFLQSRRSDPSPATYVSIDGPYRLVNPCSLSVMYNKNQVHNASVPKCRRFTNWAYKDFCYKCL